MVTELMVDTPQARPSSPSMRLTALVMATIQMRVTGMDSHPSCHTGLSLKMLGLERTWMRLPESTATRAAAICTTNFSLAGRA